MIEAVDSFKLLKEIDKQAAKYDRVIKVLLELHIAEESTKYGLTLEACRQLLAEGEWRSLEPIAVECRSTMVRIGTMIFGPRVY